MFSNSGIDLSTGFGLVFLTGTLLPFLLNPITARISDNNQKKRVVYFASFVVAILLMASKGAYSSMAWDFSRGVPGLWVSAVQAVGVTIGSWGVITVLSKNIYDGVIKPEAIIGNQKKVEAVIASQEAIKKASQMPIDDIPVAELLRIYKEVKEAASIAASPEIVQGVRNSVTSSDEIGKADNQ